jgi:hypothetical protein
MCKFEYVQQHRARWKANEMVRIRAELQQEALTKLREEISEELTLKLRREVAVSIVANLNPEDVLLSIHDKMLRIWKHFWLVEHNKVRNGEENSSNLYGVVYGTMRLDLEKQIRREFQRKYDEEADDDTIFADSIINSDNFDSASASFSDDSYIDFDPNNLTNSVLYADIVELINDGAPALPDNYHHKGFDKPDCTIWSRSRIPTIDQILQDSQIPEFSQMSNSSRILDNQILNNQILADQTLDDQFLNDQTLDDHILDNQILDNQILDNQILTDQTLDDQSLNDQILDDHKMDDQILDDRIPLSDGVQTLEELQDLVLQQIHDCQDHDQDENESLTGVEESE